MTDFEFNSRRSTVHSTKGIVSSTQPLANAAGLKVLEQGGNAAMAAVAVAAAIGVTEPMMNGIGGDAFGLYYDAKSKTVNGFNGSGKTASKATLDMIEKGDRIKQTSIHSVTVPGAVCAWHDVVKKWGNGKLTLGEIIQPAIDLAKDGFPVSEVCAYLWEKAENKLKSASPDNYQEILPDDKAPKVGELMVCKELAEALERIAKDGKNGFYKGETADKIIEVVKKKGGVMSHEDLANHTTLFVDSVNVDYQGVQLHEIPPNGQGLVALQALSTLKELNKRGDIDLSKLEHNSVQYLHAVIETLKFAFKDGEEYISCPELLDYDPNDLLHEDYVKQRADLFNKNEINHEYDYGVLNPSRKSDTVYFTVSDAEGNACSFITSVYSDFGSGIIPQGCGFALQNRGCNFNLKQGTRNVFAGGKRPYHTIIPGMITQGEDLYAAYGVMGAFMQPQGHVQVLNNMVLYGMTPQQALDAPRICLTIDDEYADSGLGADSPVSSGNRVIVACEDGISDKVIEGLEKLGHKTRRISGHGRALFGRGQIIKRVGKVWSAGSDPRGDGAAVPQL